MWDLLAWHLTTRGCCWYFFTLALLRSMKWKLSVALICISPMTNDDGRLFKCLPSTYLLWWSSSSNHSSMFKIGLFVLSLLNFKFLYLLWIQVLCGYVISKYIFSSVCSLFSHSLCNVLCRTKVFNLVEFQFITFFLCSLCSWSCI